MSADRELLEMAAKAAGIAIDPLDAIHEPDQWSAWNPLHIDGDALRLAVKLRLHVSVFADVIGIGTPGLGYDESKWTGDPYAATRRAIVRAAAEIGRGMP